MNQKLYNNDADDKNDSCSSTLKSYMWKNGEKLSRASDIVKLITTELESFISLYLRYYLCSKR